MSDFRCVDCQLDTITLAEYYAVHDDVWKASGLSDGMLCIGCLETRLGRQLVAADFTSALINVLGSRSPRIDERLSQ